MKYRQRGYKEDERDDDGRQRRRDNKKDDLGNRHQVRSLRHAIDREVTVVTRCGPRNAARSGRQTGNACRQAANAARYGR